MGRCSTGNNGNNGRGLATFMPPSLSSSANVAKPCPQGRAKLMMLMTTTNGDPPAKQRNTIEAKWALLLIENLPQALAGGTFSINSNSLDSKRSGKIMSYMDGGTTVHLHSSTSQFDTSQLSESVVSETKNDAEPWLRRCSIASATSQVHGRIPWSNKLCSLHGKHCSCSI